MCVKLLSMCDGGLISLSFPFRSKYVSELQANFKRLHFRNYFGCNFIVYISVEQKQLSCVSGALFIRSQGINDSLVTVDIICWE